LIEVPISPELVERARQMADKVGKIAGTFTDGEGMTAGFVGELLVCEHIGAVSANTYQFDLDYRGLKLEVKTKRCNSQPKSDYGCDVSCRNLKQKADFYVFARVMNDFSVGWLLGVIGKTDFFMNAQFHEKGDRSFGGFQYSASCLSIPVNKLKPFEELDIAAGAKTPSASPDSNSDVSVLI
jgi:hypothetical protein